MTKQLFGLIPAAALVGAILAGPVVYAESIAPANVKGEVIKIEGPLCVVKDNSGKEVKLQIDSSTTKKDGEIRVGDRVDIDVTPQGYARVIRKEGSDRLNMGPNSMTAPTAPRASTAPASPGLGPQ